MLRLSLLILFVSLTAPSIAFELQSSKQRVQLLELYTSEGCSSCPPADRWLSGYLEDKRLWSSIVPLAFHVDYWDYIGWKDPFAQPRYSARQRDYRARGHLSSVYTPGIIAGGQEWRRWFVDRARPEPSLADAAVLHLDTAENGTFTAHYGAPADVLHVAWLGFNVASSVKAGENRGSEFSHDFVVLAHQQYTGASRWQGELPARPDPKHARALVAWVSAADDPVPLQAVGGWYE